jgi:lysophospholipase L1-like esterase
MKPKTSRSLGSRSAILAALVLGAALLEMQPTAARQGEHWVGTWATAPVARPQFPPPPVAPLAPPTATAQSTPPPTAPAPFMHFNNQTLRQIVHTSIGGRRVRVVLSNAFGITPVTVGAAHIALRDKEATIVAASGRRLTFSGRPTMAIPAGAVLFSDPVELASPAMADLAIDVYLPGNTNTPSPLTYFASALQTSYVSETGNHAGASPFPVVATTPSSFLLARVEVMAPQAVGAIVAYGDSITAGSRSTVDTNNRYPNHLARRLQASPTPMGVLNAGIGGNRVLSEGAFTAGTNAVGRFDRDVMTQTGVTHVIVLEGINDIGNARENPTPTAEDLIAGHKQLIERAHTRGIKIFGATLTPFEGAAYYTAVGEAKRQAVNRWIRTSGAYDGVIDFDLATRDPGRPARFLPPYDSGDQLHPSDAGYKAMADAIDLALFRPAVATATVRR